MRREEKMKRAEAKGQPKTSTGAPASTVSVAIKVVANDRDWRHAHDLIVEYLAWADAEVGIERIQAPSVLQHELANLSGMYTPPRGMLLLATLDRRPVGVVGVVVEVAGWAEMKRLYVSPAARGRGLGERLVRAAKAAAADLSCRTLRLETIPGAMDEAIALYRRLGFRPTAELECAATVDLSLECAVGGIAESAA
jgi:GNAT superfamily N-acetyltransferase